ncbi:hypothetical protein R6Q59_036637 [Mikania micrantha]
MPDPLTTLMHVVQVMNLLKTLITKTLREREETTVTRGPQTDSHFDNHEEMQTSSELRERVSVDEDRHSEIGVGDLEVESLSEIEENFLEQKKKKKRNKNTKNRFKKDLNDLVTQRSSLFNDFDYKEGS